MKPFITVTLLHTGVTAQLFIHHIGGVADQDPKTKRKGCILLLNGQLGSAEVRHTRAEVWDKMIDATSVKETV